MMEWIWISPMAAVCVVFIVENVMLELRDWRKMRAVRAAELMPEPLRSMLLDDLLPAPAATLNPLESSLRKDEASTN